ncbi:MAG: serine/threonine protein kinase [Gemmatimonadaceae bacterium]|nr:serine/threonine protein kinase [Gemmatimonadaceae bacterium]
MPPLEHEDARGSVALSKRCPVCKRWFAQAAQFCSWDASVLETFSDGTIGSEMEGRFVIERRLGQGGMGEVWLAFDKKLRRRVAVKRISNAHDLRGEEKARFKREAQNAGSLDHPNVVRVLELVDTIQDPILILEYVPGLTLSEIVRNSGALPSQVVAAVVNDLARGLAAVHRAGYVHRDLKPANVIISTGSDQVMRAKILDFGLARSLHDPSQAITMPEHAVGTPLYMSPEQLWGADVDIRTDVFALAAVAAYMLAGKLGYPGYRLPLTLKHVPNADWSPALRDCIARGLAGESDARFQTPSEFASALAEVLSTEIRNTPPLQSSTAGEGQNTLLPTTQESLAGMPLKLG